MKSLSYEAAGVSVERGERFVERLKRLSARSGQNALLKAAGGYAAVYPVADERCIALTTDGVGTKVLLAKEYQQHQGIGVDLVAMCANDLICVGARPTLFLDYYATGVLDEVQGLELIEGILEGCDQSGMLLVGGETAEMPDVYQPGHYDLAGFAVGELNRTQLLTGEKIQPGQKVIGVAASGIHSNGLSLARKVLTDDNQRRQLLEPTRIYVKPVLSLLEAFGKDITGIAHITGGGWRNVLRLNPDVGFEMTQLLPILPVFEAILAQGVSLEECFKTFNMGMGLVITVSGNAEEVVEQLSLQGMPAQVVGEVTDTAGRVSVKPYGLEIVQK